MLSVPFSEASVCCLFALLFFFFFLIDSLRLLAETTWKEMDKKKIISPQNVFSLKIKIFLKTYNRL
jgi:hypothetical protein